MLYRMLCLATLFLGLLVWSPAAFAQAAPNCTPNSPCTCGLPYDDGGLKCVKCTTTGANGTTYEGQACGGSGSDAERRRENGACKNARVACGCTTCRDSEDSSAAAAGSRACAIFNSQQLDSSSVLTEKQLQAALDCRNSLRRK